MLHKGGLLHEPYKNKGPITDSESYRDIFLCAIMAMAQHSHSRSHLAVGVNHLAATAATRQA